MYKVKFTPYRDELGKIMLRQTKDGLGISSDGRYKFYLDEIDEADFWVVQGKGIRNEVSCKVAPENTLLLTTEPRSVLVYPKSYIKQFGTVFSNQEYPEHENLILGPALLPWFVGYKKSNDNGLSYWLDYNKLVKNEAPIKSKLISVITSNKVFTKGHQDRIEFVEKLKDYYGEKLDVFGRGFCDFDDKWDVLAPYKYHIAIENFSTKYYWTEKISDCFLTETFPIYHGCTNLSDYFPKSSFQSVNIYDFDSAVKIIDRIIAEDTYEEKREILKKCKSKVLKEYNIFDYVAKLCDEMNPFLPKKNVTLKPCRSIDDRRNIYNYMINRSLFKLKYNFKKIFKGESVLYKDKC